MVGPMPRREVAVRKRPWARYVAALTEALHTSDYTKAYSELAIAYNYFVPPRELDREVSYTFVESSQD